MPREGRALTTAAVATAVSLAIATLTSNLVIVIPPIAMVAATIAARRVVCGPVDANDTAIESRTRIFSPESQV